MCRAILLQSLAEDRLYRIPPKRLTLGQGGARGKHDTGKRGKSEREARGLRGMGVRGRQWKSDIGKERERGGGKGKTAQEWQRNRKREETKREAIVDETGARRRREGKGPRERVKVCEHSDSLNKQNDVKDPSASSLELAPRVIDALSERRHFALLKPTSPPTAQPLRLRRSKQQSAGDWRSHFFLEAFLPLAGSGALRFDADLPVSFPLLASFVATAGRSLGTHSGSLRTCAHGRVNSCARSASDVGQASEA
eukprot:5664111-Pleurochrysis_carterae.AAC.1